MLHWTIYISQGSGSKKRVILCHVYGVAIKHTRPRDVGGLGIWGTFSSYQCKDSRDKDETVVIPSCLCEEMLISDKTVFILKRTREIFVNQWRARFSISLAVYPFSCYHNIYIYMNIIYQYQYQSARDHDNEISAIGALFCVKWAENSLIA